MNKNKKIFLDDKGSSGADLSTKVIMATVIASVGAIMYNGFDNTIAMIASMGSFSEKKIISKEAKIKHAVEGDAKIVEKSEKALFKVF